MSNTQKKTSAATIGESIFINGTVQGEEDLTIEGQIDGTIQMQEANVLVGKTGKVVADISAKSIVVEGSVRGELKGSESVEIKPSGSLIGDIRSPRVMLGDGCNFKGTVDMEQKPDAGTVERARGAVVPNSLSKKAGNALPQAPASKGGLFRTKLKPDSKVTND